VRKAHPYFSTELDEENTLFSENASLPPIRVRVLSSEHLVDAHTTHTKVLVNRKYSVDHYLYKGWPDHGVPDFSEPLLALAKVVDESTAIDVPVLVHCSAGIGRTGAFIALCSLLRHHGLLRSAGSVEPIPSPLGRLEDDLAQDEVVCEIDGLRDQRPGMVQRDEQAEWIYRTLADALKKSS